jgi:hypothetical protein
MHSCCAELSLPAVQLFLFVLGIMPARCIGIMLMCPSSTLLHISMNGTHTPTHTPARGHPENMLGQTVAKQPTLVVRLHTTCVKWPVWPEKPAAEQHMLRAAAGISAEQPYLCHMTCASNAVV